MDKFPWYYVLGGAFITCLLLGSFFVIVYMLGTILLNILF